MFEGLRRVFREVVNKAATRELGEDELDEIRFSLLVMLSENDVAIEAAEHIADATVGILKEIRVSRLGDRGRVVREALKRILFNILSKPRVDLFGMARSTRPFVIVFLGPNGHGKTTTVAKFAWLFKKKGFAPVIAAADTFRAGAIEQVEEHGKRIGVKVIKHGYGADPAAVAYDAVKHAFSRKLDVVLIDTAGRMQTDRDLMEEMKKIVRVVNPHLKIFVGDALAGNDVLEQVRSFHQEVGISGSVLTKADADTKGGAVVSVVYASGKPVLYLGVGQGYDDLIEFEPSWFISRVLE